QWIGAVRKGAKVGRLQFSRRCVAPQSASSLRPHPSPRTTLAIFIAANDNCSTDMRGCQMIQGIDNIGICTTDVARSVAFYQRLGFSEAYRNERGVLMAVGNVHLFIFATRQSHPPAVAGVSQSRRSAGAAYHPAVMSQSKERRFPNWRNAEIALCLCRD